MDCACRANPALTVVCAWINSMYPRKYDGMHSRTHALTNALTHALCQPARAGQKPKATALVDVVCIPLVVFFSFEAGYRQVKIHTSISVSILSIKARVLSGTCYR